MGKNVMSKKKNITNSFTALTSYGFGFRDLSLVLAGLLISGSSLAAVVEIDTPAAPGATSYTIPGDSTVYQIYQTDTPDGTIVDPSVNGGVEFILLGAHETIVHESNDVFNDCINQGNCNSTISVTLNNANPGQTTKGVSLLLTAAEALTWDINITDAGIDIQSIYVFGTGSQVVNLVGGNANQVIGSSSVCAFSYPDSLGGCQTDELLGIETDNNFLGFKNRLGNETNLKITSFNGSYFVDGFTVTIDSTTAIPLPGAFVLMLSALAGLGVRKLV